MAIASVSFIDATCTAGETVVLGDTNNATWGAITDPAGPNDYSVTATAKEGAEFAGGLAELNFRGKLDPIDNGRLCDSTTSAPSTTNTISTKVDFCHATSSESNPYAETDTSVNAFFQSGHNSHQNFGDIVPPFNYLDQGQTTSFAGLNWDANGQAILKNGCKDVTVPSTATASVSFTDATCTVAQEVVLGGVNKATWGAITDPAGTDDYTVTATATTGAQFAGGLTELTFHGQLNPIDNGPNCDTTPATATASVSFTNVTCTVAQQLILDSVNNATWGEITDPAGTDDYTVTATATTGAQFAGGLTELTFHGQLNPIDNGPNCDITTAPSTATASVTFTDATCAAGQIIALGDAVNATWGEITDPAGTDDYTVTATATEGAQFAGGLTELTFHGQLSGILDPFEQWCQLPTEALVLPVVTFTQFTCDSDGSINLGVDTGYDPTHVTFTVNGVTGILSGTYVVAEADTTTVTAQAVYPNGLESRWVTPAAFKFAVPSDADCSALAATGDPGSRLAFTGMSDPIAALALGGGFLFLGIATRHLGRRRHTIR
jgi:hypothetical protein